MGGLRDEVLKRAGVDTRCAWLVYGSLNQPTGGYVYDRLVVEGLQRVGLVVDVMDLATVGAVKHVAEKLGKGAYDCVVGDELCHSELAELFGQLRAGRAHELRPKLVTLVHHLQASETGVMSESERLALAQSDCVVTTSHTTARQVARWTNVPLRVCLPGADRLPSLPRLPSASRELCLLFVGTWTERKGLLRAFEYLRRLPDANFRFAVVGDAAREPHYARAVWELLEFEPWLKQRTNVHGVLTDDELAAVYAESDLLILPSSYEGYGMVLTEALHAGVAVLVADVGATSEVIRHDLDGLLLPANEAEQWVHVLRQLANDRASLERWARHGRRLPTWAETVAGFADVIEQP